MLEISQEKSQPYETFSRPQEWIRFIPTKDLSDQRFELFILLEKWISRKDLKQNCSWLPRVNCKTITAVSIANNNNIYQIARSKSRGDTVREETKLTKQAKSFQDCLARVLRRVCIHNLFVGGTRLATLMDLRIARELTCSTSTWFIFNVFLEQDTVRLVSFMSPQCKMYELMSDSAIAFSLSQFIIIKRISLHKIFNFKSDVPGI